MRVLITGITGFAGTYLAEHIVERHGEASVWGLARWDSPTDNLRPLQPLVKLVTGALNIDRGCFIEELKARGIGASVHFIPLHLHPYYRDTYGYAPQDLPVAAACYERSVSLPIYSRMSDADVSRVTDAVNDIAATYRR